MRGTPARARGPRAGRAAGRPGGPQWCRSVIRAWRGHRRAGPQWRRQVDTAFLPCRAPPAAGGRGAPGPPLARLPSGQGPGAPPRLSPADPGDRVERGCTHLCGPGPHRSPGRLRAECGGRGRCRARPGGDPARGPGRPGCDDPLRWREGEGPHRARPRRRSRLADRRRAAHRPRSQPSAGRCRPDARLCSRRRRRGRDPARPGLRRAPRRPCRGAGRGTRDGGWDAGGGPGAGDPRSRLRHRRTLDSGFAGPLLDVVARR